MIVLISAFIPIAGNLNEVKLGPDSFHIRLDHLLHITVYFLICMYFLAGVKMKLSLFKKNPLKKFILLVLFLAIITELIQLWVPERAFNVFDLLSNVAGVGAGVGVIRVAQGTSEETKRRKDEKTERLRDTLERGGEED